MVGSNPRFCTAGRERRAAESIRAILHGFLLQGRHFSFSSYDEHPLLTDGSVDGVRYFQTARPLHGLFSRPSNIRRLEPSGPTNASHLGSGGMNYRVTRPWILQGSHYCMESYYAPVYTLSA